ncbi:MAG: clostripain-related cysteine peptidase [Vicinamibacteria bacterium]
MVVKKKREAQGKPEAEAEIKTAAAAHEKKAPGGNDSWVVLVYMASTSPELRSIMEADLAEMAERARLLMPNSIEIYALMDTPEGKYAILHTVHDRKDKLPDPCVVRAATGGKDKRLGRKGSLLSQLIDWRFKAHADAVKDPQRKAFDRTLLMLWGHSQGVASALSQPGSPAYAMVGNGGFGLNEISGDSLSLPQIRRAIADGLGSHEVRRRKARIDVLTFDSCFMGAAEVSAEFQEQPGNADDPSARVDYVVASQTAVLLDGLDYSRLIDVFIEEGDAGSVAPLKVGRRLVEQASSTTQSPVSLSLLHTGCPGPYVRFETAFRTLVEELSKVLDAAPDRPTDTDTEPQRLRVSQGLLVRKELQKRQRRRHRDHLPQPAPPLTGIDRAEWLRIREAFEGATWHRVRQFVDVGDLCRRLANNSRVRDLRLAAIAVLASLALPKEDGLEADHLVLDVRSQHPLLLSGLSLYCPWLFPTPEEVRAGAWNAVVDLYDYARELRFNRGNGSWGAFLFNARHLLEESRQRAINTEVADLRLADEDARRTYAAWSGAPAHATEAPAAVARVRKEGGGDSFSIAEPMAAVRAGGATALPLRDTIAARAAALGHTDRIPIRFDPPIR